MLILHRFRDINTNLQKIKTPRDLNHAHLGGQFVIITTLVLLTSTCAQNLTILTSAIPEKFNFKEVQNFEMDHVTRAANFQGCRSSEG